MLAYYVHHWSPFIIEFGRGFGIRWYGTAYVMAFVCAYLLLRWFSRNGYSQMPESKVGEFIGGVAIWGVLLGGRLGYALFYDFNGVLSDPLRLIRVWEGGMSSHGGILGIVLYTYYYARRHKISWTGIGDNVVVAAPIGIFFGRMANFINGELYGVKTQVAWAVQFPNELRDDPVLAQRAITACVTKIDPHLATPEAIIAAANQSEPVRAVLSTILTPRHPSQLYEAALEGIVLFVSLWILRTRMRLPEGVVTGAFFVLYALLRIIGEQFRQPDIGIALTYGMSRGHFLSLFMIAIGAAFIVSGVVRKRPSPHPGNG